MKNPSKKINMGAAPDFQADDPASQTSIQHTAKRWSSLPFPRWIKHLHLIFTIGLGSCFLLGALFLFYRTVTFVSRATSTTGTVIEHEDKTTSSSSSNRATTTTTTYYPVVQFQLPQGGSIQFVSKGGLSSPDDRPLGAKVPVLFDPNNPNNAEINSFGNIWGGVIFMFVFGTIWTAMGIFSRRFLWKKDRWMPPSTSPTFQ